MSRVLSVLSLFIILLISGAEGARATGTAADVRGLIVPHKARYDIKMIARHSGAAILNIKGVMDFEWQRGCEAWTTNHHFDLRYEYADGPPMNVVSDFSTYETYDGKNFTFSARRYRDGDLYEELRGGADPQQAVFTMPEGLTFDLPAGAFFPMAHTIETLKEIRESKKFFNATVFDGSDDEGPVEINTFIGKPVNAMAYIKPSAALDAALVNTPAWNVRMAFFPLNKPESESDYEMNIVFHENGVISDMMVEYDDFSVTQKLVALEKLTPEPCEKGEQATPVPVPPQEQKKKKGWFQRFRRGN